MPALALVALIRFVDRLARAVGATFNLLRDKDVRRALPWSYLRRLPRQNVWVAILTLSLAVSIAASVLGLIVPGQTAGQNSAAVAFAAALIGLLSSFARQLYRHRRIRS
jgi:VanZ family protein